MALGSSLTGLILLLFSAFSASAQPLPALLKPVDLELSRGAAVSSPSRGIAVRRQRFVEINRDAILAPSDQARRISLALFPDATYEVEETRAYWNDDQSTFLWTGKIAGMQRAHAVIAITGEIVSANISTDSGEFYWLRQVEGAIHSVQQVEMTANPLDRDDAVVPNTLEPTDSKQRTPERLATTTRDAVASVSVLVVYTPAARNAAGGTSAMTNKINLAIAEMNQSFTNSSVAITVQLAAALEINYTEAASISTDLDNLRGTSDGQMDNVHALRNQYGADLVALLIQRNTGSTVGQGFIMQTPGSYFASWAFSVTEQSYTTGPYYTLSHELGHNMGSAHDRDNAGSAGAYSYSYGYQGANFRTIMAYSCDDRDCPRVNYWSNPSVNYNAAPTGVPSNQADSADNAQSLNNTGAVVAAFRSAPTGCTYSINPLSLTAPSGGTSSSFGITAGSGCNWTATSNNTGWITITSGASGTANGSVSFTAQANTGTARTGTITAAGQTFTVSQNASVCTYSLNPTSATFTSDGAAASIAVTAGTGCAWTASTANSWIQITAGQSGAGNGVTGYSVTANTGAARNGAITIAGQSFPISQNASPGTTITITSNPTGRTIQVDGVPIVTPQSLTWTPGSTHTLSAATQGAGTRFTFLTWSDSGTATHSITAPSNPATYTAAFQTQYLLTRTMSPAAGGSIAASPSAGDGYYNSGTAIAATATPASGYTFSTWSGALATASNPVNLTMDGQKTITANFVSQTGATITSTPTGRTVIVDGASYVAPAVFQWTTGSIHSIGAPSPQQDSGIQYTFSSWSDGGSPSHSITAGVATATYSAAFTATSLCSYTLSQSAATILATGDLRQVNINTTSGCSWTATSNATWLTILSGAAGTGTGSLRFTAEQNTSPLPRTATLNIAGLSYTVTQSAVSCTYTLSGPLTALPSGAATFPVTISTQPGCQWSAYAYPSFLSTSPSVGTSNGSVNVSLSANPNTAARIGVVTIGGQSLQILQQGSLTAPLFTDVPTNYLFLDYINLLKLNNISPGCTASTYCPEAMMLRTEMAAFIIRALYGEAFSYSPTPFFTDVPATHPYFKYIQKMRDQGITVGCTNTTYCPDGQVSRGQMAAFLVRARLAVTQGTPFPHAPGAYFTDVDPSHLFFSFIQKMKELGITSGCTATSYCPENLVTRGQMSVFVNRAVLY